MSRYKTFDRSKLKIRSLFERESKTGLDSMINPDSKPPKLTSGEYQQIRRISSEIISSRKNQRPVLFAYGAHAVKNGCSSIIIRMMEEGLIQQLLTNGAGVIHDFELSYLKRTEEDVRKYLPTGEFGLWQETDSLLNRTINAGAKLDKGIGESVGELISSNKNKFQGSNYSIVGNAYKLKIPFSSCIGIGYDIIHEHPEADGASLGKASYTDFLIFVQSVSEAQGGVFLSVGSAIMAPMVLEKALSMARNVAKQKKEKIDNFLIAVNDIQPATWDWSKGEPPKSNPAYYSRFCKSFSRMNTPFLYVDMDNRKFLHNLYSEIKNKSNK